MCKFLLLEIAPPDSLIRLSSTPLVDEQSDLCRMYQEEQHHSSLKAFLEYHIHLPGGTKGWLMQVIIGAS